MRPCPTEGRDEIALTDTKTASVEGRRTLSRNRMRPQDVLVILAVVACTTACVFVIHDDDPAPFPSASEFRASSDSAPGADSSRFLAHVKQLASDEFGGRGPGSDGEDRTVDYLIAQMKRIGLEPAGPNGSWTQDVPLVGFRGAPFDAFHAGAESCGVEWPHDCGVI
jgi:hypothetical protein